MYPDFVDVYDATERVPILRIYLCCVFFALFGVAALSVEMSAQTTQPNISASDKAHELLNAALKINGLAGDDLKPWHLKATYQVELVGSPPDTVTMEVWAGSQYQWRRTYTGKHYNGTLWSVSRTERLHTDDPLQSSLPYASIGEPLLYPLDGASLIRPDYEMELRALSVGVALNCIDVLNPEKYLIHSKVKHLPSYCFDQNYRLRLSSLGDLVMQFDSYQMFQNHVIASHVRATFKGAPYWEIKLMQLEALAPGDAVTIAPDKRAVSESYVLRPSDPQPVPIHQVAGPTYLNPTDMRQGETIWIPIVIQKDGSVKVPKDKPYEIRSSDGKTSQTMGSAYLSTAKGIAPLVRAAERWRFEPYQIDGQTVEVSTTVPFTEDGNPWKQP